MATTLTAGRKRILRELDVGMFIPNAYISALAAGSFTSPSFFQDPVMAPDFLQVRNTGVVRGGAATSADFWRPAGTITIGTGVVAVAPNWADTTLGSEDIELWYHRVRPDQEVLDSLNRVLIKEFVTSYLAVSHISRVDGDMSLSTDTSWTDVGTTTTSAKATTEAFVPWGMRSYHTINSVADSGTRSTGVRVKSLGRINAFTIAQTEVGTSSLMAVNPLTAATFGTAVTSGERRPQLLCFKNQEVPSTAETASAYMTNTSASGDTYWNQAWLYNLDNPICPLPALVADSFQVPKIIQAVPLSATSSNVYDAENFDFRPLTEGIDYWFVINQADAQPYKVRFKDTSYFEWPLFVETRIPQASLVTVSAEGDSFWDLNKVIPRWKKDLLETVYNTGPRRHPDWERQYNLAGAQLLEAGKARQKESIAPAKEPWVPMLNA